MEDLERKLLQIGTIIQYCSSHIRKTTDNEYDFENALYTCFEDLDKNTCVENIVKNYKEDLKLRETIIVMCIHALNNRDPTTFTI